MNGKSASQDIVLTRYFYLQVIHNYGHGGVGYGLSVGCAQEVCELILKHQKDIRISKL